MTVSDFGPASVSWLQSNIFLFAACFSIAMASLAAALAGVVSVFALSPSVNVPEDRPARASSTPRLNLVLAFSAGAAIVGWLALSVSWEAFTFWDNHHFFRPLRGEPQYTSPPINPQGGRFFPLGYQEFEWLALVDGSGFFYRVFSCFQIVIVCVCAVFVIRARLAMSVLLVAAIVLTPVMVQTFTQLIYPERNIVFLLAIYLLFTKKFIESGRTIAAFASTIAGSLIVFYKETAFVILFAMGIVFLTSYLLSKADQRPKRYLVVAVPPLLVSIIFLSYYYGVIDPMVVSAYGDQRVRPLALVVERLISKPWIWVLGASLGVRIWQLVRTGGTINPFWDGIAAVAGTLIAAYLVLGYDAPHFYAPAAFAAWLYAFHTARTLGPPKGGRIASGVFVAFIAVAVIAQLNATWNGFRGRKELVHSKASAARFVADYAAIRGLGTEERPIYLHPLPSAKFAGGLFGGYIEAEYDLNVVVAISDETAVDGGQCLHDIPVKCVFRPGSQTGELVVALGPRFARDLEGRNDLKLVFVSEDIGFWRNRQRASVFVVE